MELLGGVVLPGFVVEGGVVEDGVVGPLLEGRVVPGVQGAATVPVVPLGREAPLVPLVVVPIDPVEEEVVLPTPEVDEVLEGTPLVLLPGEVLVVLHGPEMVPVVVPGVVPL